MPVSTFTLIHVLISLVGILTGVVVALGLCGNRRFGSWTGAFLITTLLTSLTGFLFPLKAIGSPHIVGAISLVLDLRYYCCGSAIPQRLRGRGASSVRDNCGRGGQEIPPRPMLTF